MGQEEQGTVLQLVLGPRRWFTANVGLHLGLGLRLELRLRVCLLQGGLSVTAGLQVGMDLSQPFYTAIS